jgi:hypothetical protein
LKPCLQVYNNMLGDMDFFSDPAAALANAVVKTNDQMHAAVCVQSHTMCSSVHMHAQHHTQLMNPLSLVSGKGGGTELIHVPHGILLLRGRMVTAHASQRRRLWTTRSAAPRRCACSCAGES